MVDLRLGLGLGIREVEFFWGRVRFFGVGSSWFGVELGSNHKDATPNPFQNQVMIEHWLEMKGRNASWQLN